MDLVQSMKAGPSITKAAWSTGRTSATKHARNFIAATSTVIILAFLYVAFGNVSLEPFGSRWSLLFGNGGNSVHSGGLRGDQYLLGVGKADITGYEVFLDCINDHVLT